MLISPLIGCVLFVFVGSGQMAHALTGRAGAREQGIGALFDGWVC
jgi:hypothetical protein